MSVPSKRSPEDSKAKEGANASPVLKAISDVKSLLDNPFEREEGKQIEDPQILHHIAEIEKALGEDPVNADRLRELARFGFVNNELRAKVWPHLLGVDSKQSYKRSPENHKWEDQVEKDIERSLVHFDLDKKLTDGERDVARQGLKMMIDSIFSDPTNQALNYIQGFHDVCIVFFRICGRDLGTMLIDNLSKRHIRDTLRPNLDTMLHILSLLFPLIECEDPEVFTFLSRSQVQPHFAISWVLTWFAHDLESFSDVSRLYDFFLANHPLMPLYYSVVIILSRRDELLRVECEYSAVHKFFQTFPHDTGQMTENMEKTLQLSKRHPPGTVAARHRFFPKDSPMLARDVRELANLKQDYSHPLYTILDPYQRQFWTHFALPIGTAFMLAYVCRKYNLF